jgi:predicted SnoaL-like aldol condensation-catalyzing enzyme
MENSRCREGLNDGPTRVVDLEKTEANKAVMRGYLRDVVFGGQRDKVAQYKSPDHFHQHNCNGEDNRSCFQTKTAVFAKPGFVFKYDKLYKVLGQGKFVFMMSEGLFDGKPTAFYDLYRLGEGKQVEHWVALETIPLQRSGRIPTASCRPYTPPSVFK